ncbi:MAG: ATP-binding protein [Desulforhopalus sp.]
MNHSDLRQSHLTALLNSSDELKKICENGQGLESDELHSRMLSAIMVFQEELQQFNDQAGSNHKELPHSNISQQNINREVELFKLLQLSVDALSSGRVYDRFLDIVLSYRGLGADPGGLLYILKENSLVLQAHKNIAKDVVSRCVMLKPGKCLCGRAVAEKKVVFADSKSDTQEHHCARQQSKVNYFVPILNLEQEVLGCLSLSLEKNTIYDSRVEEVLVASAMVMAAILKRKEIEEKLSEWGEQLTSIYSAADNVALIVCELVSDDCRIVRFSPGAEKMFGYREEEVVGKSIAILYLEEDKHHIPMRVDKLRRGMKLCSPERIMLRKDGVQFHVEAVVSPLVNSQREISRALAVCTDISELKQVQQKLERANRELEERVKERTRELQMAQKQILQAEKLAAVGQLSASIAHEFNNPLQGVMAVLKGVFKRAVIDKEDEKLVDAAVGECNRMVRLIQDLQGFNRPSSGKAALVSLNRLVDANLMLYKSEFRKKEINLDKQFSGNLPAVSVISDQIRQVVLNLLNNAVDACSSGCTIRIETKEIGGNAQLTISDTGRGIHPDHISHVFEPFFTTKTAGKGTGLGLSVCYGIIKSHNGSISVESQVDRGTSFIIQLPAGG